MELFSRNMIIFTSIALAIIIDLHIQLATGGLIGVNLGLSADNLPAPRDIIAQYEAENIVSLRLFEPHPAILNALRGKTIEVAIGVKNKDVVNIAMDVNTANQWVNKNVVNYIDHVDIEWIVVGNEMVPSHPNATLVSQAMNNILSALNEASLTYIKVTTAVGRNVLEGAFPPSAGCFSDDSFDIMQVIAAWLASTNNPLFINVYPYSAYVYEPGRIGLDFALFNATQALNDSDYMYYSLFEAMVDAYNVALGKVGGENVTVVVSETGWPNAGNDNYTSKEIAHAYNQRLINKVKQAGTPRKPLHTLDVFIFAMYNEDKKPGGIDRNWGIHYADKSPVYPLHFN